MSGRSGRSGSPARAAGADGPAGGGAAPAGLSDEERRAYQALVQAKWKAVLARDRAGFQGDRLYQFGQLTEELLEEAVRAVRAVWQHVSQEAVRSSLEAFHTHLLHQNVGAGNRILVAAPDLLGLPRDFEALSVVAQPIVEEPAPEPSASQLLGPQMVEGGTAGDHEYTVSASEEAEEGEEAQAQEHELPPGLEEELEDIEVVLEDEPAEADAAPERSAAGAQSLLDQAVRTPLEQTGVAAHAARRLEPAFHATQLEGLQSALGTGPRQPASAPPHLGPATRSGAPSADAATVPGADGTTGGDSAAPGANGPGQSAQKAAPKTPSAGGPARRRAPSLPQGAPATAPAEGRKRRAADAMEGGPSLDGIIESMLAATDSAIKRLQTEAKQSELRIADKQAEADRVQEHVSQAEQELERVDAELDRANAQLVEIAKRMEDFKRQRHQTTSEASRLEQQRARVLKEIEAAQKSAQAKADAVAAKKQEARQALERSAARLTEIARTKYS